MKREKNPGEKNKYDVIRHILRDYASRENPITRKKIEDIAKKMGCHIGRNAIENFMNEMLVKDYETEEECDMILSILVDTFISKISFPMKPGPEIGSISDA